MGPALDLPALSLVTDRRRCQGRTLEEVVEAAVAGGVRMVQLREKDLSSSELLRLAQRLRAITTGRALLFVNDRVDVAVAAGADGVQLGEKGLPVEAVRRVAGDALLIGRSVHEVEGGTRAETEGADLLILGSIFPTESHPLGVPKGLGPLQRLSSSVSVPVLGIGGVRTSNVGEMMDAGAAGAAVITAITKSADPTQAARELVGVMEARYRDRRPARIGAER